MALLAEMPYNFITLVYIVSKYITDTTICVCSLCRYLSLIHI